MYIVKHLNIKSIQFHVPSGVPQRDLSTLLLNILINDLPNNIINSEISLFADDAKLVKIKKKRNKTRSTYNPILIVYKFSII